MKKNLHLESLIGCPLCDNGHKEYEIIEEGEILTKIKFPNFKEKISNMLKDAYYHIKGVYHFHVGY